MGIFLLRFLIAYYWHTGELHFLVIFSLFNCYIKLAIALIVWHLILIP